MLKNTIICPPRLREYCYRAIVKKSFRRKMRITLSAAIVVDTHCKDDLLYVLDYQGRLRYITVSV